MECKKCGTRNDKESIYCKRCGANLVNRIAKRGFASMSTTKRSAIASSGGKKAHQMGRAHTWSSEEARAAGRKGGSNRKKTKTAKNFKA